MHIFLLSLFSLSFNILLGRFRKRYDKFTVRWWLLIHASIPLIIPARMWLDIPHSYAPLFILLAVTGQYIGARRLTV
ncbi:MAG: hypothetical protein ACRDDZ_04570 [Marinifilaceae bacterium]